MKTTNEVKSIAEKQDDIVAEFSVFDDWQDSYKHIIDIGRKLPDLDESLKTEDNKVRGCQSQVWLHAWRDNGEVYYAADSDAMIVRGLVALVVRVYSGHAPDEILTEAPTFIDRIGMSEQLTPGRSNGLQSMVKKIKYYALAFKAIQERKP